VRAVGEHTEINKTTETQRLQRKAMPFYEKSWSVINEDC
jgi:hypothetical protein